MNSCLCSLTPVQLSDLAVKQCEMCIPSDPPNHRANGGFCRAREHPTNGPSSEPEGMRCTTCNRHLPLSEFCDGSNRPLSVCSHCALTFVSLCSHFCLTVLSLLPHSALAVLSLHCLTALSSLHGHFCVTLFSLLSHCALTTEVKISPNHLFFPL